MFTAMMVVIHFISACLLVAMCNIMADWSCIPKDPQKRADRAMMILAVLIPVGLMMLYANLRPHATLP